MMGCLVCTFSPSNALGETLSYVLGYVSLCE